MPTPEAIKLTSYVDSDINEISVKNRSVVFDGDRFKINLERILSHTELG